jgi:ATP/maltotriose-dependent transcriptional regulator MalT
LTTDGSGTATIPSADFLRTESKQERQSTLHLKAARWFADHDLPEAVKHALAAGEAFRNVSLTTLLGWLNALPDEPVRANGELATCKAIVLLLTDGYAEAAPYADAAERGLAPDAPRPVRGRLSSL